MKISVNQDDSFQLEQVYLPITLVSDDKEEMTIVMRDSGFEFKYQGTWYSAKDGEVELMKKSLPIQLDGELMGVTSNFNK
ncbi:hypothetical protein CCP3SC1AL1_1830002 [Gammaproteobacteria bacterium]